MDDHETIDKAKAELAATMHLLSRDPANQSLQNRVHNGCVYLLNPALADTVPGSIGHEGGSRHFTTEQGSFYFKDAKSVESAEFEVRTSRFVHACIDEYLPSSPLFAIPMHRAFTIVFSHAVHGIRVAASTPVVMNEYLDAITALLPVLYAKSPRSPVNHRYGEKHDESIRILARHLPIPKDVLRPNDIQSLEREAEGVPFYDFSMRNVKHEDGTGRFGLCDWGRAGITAVHPHHELAMLAAEGCFLGAQNQFHETILKQIDTDHESFFQCVEYNVFRFAALNFFHSKNSPEKIAIDVGRHMFQKAYNQSLSMYETLRSTSLESV